METHRELNLTLAILIAVCCGDAAKRWRKAQTIGIICLYAVGVRAIRGRRIKRGTLTENLRSIEQIKGLAQHFKIISF